MTTRILPPDEWPRLEGTEAEQVWPLLNPATTRIVVVEQDGAIVGCQVLMAVTHAECLWIHPDHRRRASVGRRLISAVHHAAAELGLAALATSALDDGVRRLLVRLGARVLPGTHYMIDVKG